MQDEIIIFMKTQTGKRDSLVCAEDSQRFSSSVWSNSNTSFFSSSVLLLVCAIVAVDVVIIVTVNGITPTPFVFGEVVEFRNMVWVVYYVTTISLSSSRIERL